MQAKNVATADEPVLLVDAISTMQNESKYKEYRLNGSVLVASTCPSCSYVNGNQRSVAVDGRFAAAPTDKSSELTMKPHDLKLMSLKRALVSPPTGRFGIGSQNTNRNGAARSKITRSWIEQS
jgi:hypothetical protein